MPIKLGSTNFGNIYLGSTKIGSAYIGSVKVYSSQLVLPAKTIRCKFSTGYTPDMGDSQTLVDADENIWDIYKSGTDWYALFLRNTTLERVIAANTTGVTRMNSMFLGCTSLTSVPLFDTSSVTVISQMFYGCTSLTTVPLFDTSSATNMSNMFKECTSLTSVPLFDTSSAQQMGGMLDGCTSLTAVPLFDTISAMSVDYMFRNCYAVESGALALYTRATSLSHTPTTYYDTFLNCGRDTANGQAELAQIPASWGGTGA